MAKVFITLEDALTVDKVEGVKIFVHYEPLMGTPNELTQSQRCATIFCRLLYEQTGVDIQQL